MKNTKKFVGIISHNDNESFNPPTYDDWAAGQTGSGTTGGGNSGKLGSEIVNGVVTITDSILDLFRKPDTYNTYNITQGDEDKKDNTMLYVGIGGVILVVILFIVVAIKK